MTTTDPKRPAGGNFDWRSHLRIHPAADLFPLMSESELKELAADIRENGLQEPVILGGLHQPFLIDGRNRLDALASLGWLSPPRGREHREWKDDYAFFVKTRPFQISDDAIKNSRIDRAYLALRYHDVGEDRVHSLVMSLNVHRRHLTAEQKRELIAKVLKLNPEISDRQIGDSVNADHKTVGAVRSDLEGRGEIPHVKERKDSKGRKQPSQKAPPAPEPNPIGPDDRAEDGESERAIFLFGVESAIDLAADAVTRLDYRGSKQFTKSVIDELSAAVDGVVSGWQKVKLKLGASSEAAA